MKLHSRIILMVTCFMLVIFAGTTAFAERHVSYPGTAAKGMGGAYTAIARDATAIWYNPAGLSGKGTDIVVELSQAPEDDSNYDMSNGATSGFLGGKWNTNGQTGTALAWYKPYNIFDLGVNIFSGAVGHRFADSWLSIGGALEMVYTNAEDSQFFNSDVATIGLAVNVGAMADLTFLKNLDPTMSGSIGATYRSTSTDSSLDYENVDINGDHDSLRKPSSYDIGLSLSKAFTAFPSSLTGSIQYGNTDYAEVTDMINAVEYAYTRVSYGLEYSILRESAKFALRAGGYTSEVDDATNGAKYTGVTYGLGVNFGDKYGLDFAIENREREQAGQTTYDVDFLSFAVVYSFY